MSGESIARPRDANGRFVRTQCPMRNCDGVLRPEDDGWWRCDGLNHEEPDGPLYACTHSHHPKYGAAS